jgi:DNA-binding transcriptional LysR family regulator
VATTDLRQLEYFVAVAEELSFTRAAVRCRVAQSALSHQVARLERRHGVVLLERTSRAVRLAPAGELLLPRARRILAEVEEAGQALAAFAGVVTGRLRLGVVGSTLRVVPAVEDALAAFHRQYPGVQISVEDTGSSHMAEQVTTGALDLAFIGLFADQFPDDLAHRVLAVEPLVAVVPRDHPLAGRARVGLRELADGADFVEMRAESGLRTQVDAAFARAGVERAVAFALDTSDAVVRYVGLGLGVAVVPESTAVGHTAERGYVAGHSGVAALPLDDAEALHPVSLVHRRPEPSAPAARAFLDLLPRP